MTPPKDATAVIRSQHRDAFATLPFADDQDFRDATADCSRPRGTCAGRGRLGRLGRLDLRLPRRDARTPCT